MGLGLVGGGWSFSSCSSFSSFSSFSLVRVVVVAVVMNGLGKRKEKKGKKNNYILRINLLLLHSLRPASTSTFCQQ